jgi:hypothetical protein
MSKFTNGPFKVERVHGSWKQRLAFWERQKDWLANKKSRHSAIYVCRQKRTATSLNPSVSFTTSPMNSPDLDFVEKGPMSSMVFRKIQAFHVFQSPSKVSMIYERGVIRRYHDITCLDQDKPLTLKLCWPIREAISCQIMLDYQQSAVGSWFSHFSAQRYIDCGFIGESPDYMSSQD